MRRLVMPLIVTGLLVAVVLVASNALDVSPTASAQCTLTVEAIELTQATQRDPRNQTQTEIPLVAKRRTALRAYPEGTCTYPINGWFRIKEGGRVIWGPKRSLNAVTQLFGDISAISRENEDHTLNFTLPWHRLSWNRDYTFEVLATAAGSSPPLSWWWESAYSHTASFNYRKDPNIIGIPIDNQYPGAPPGQQGVPDLGLLQPGAADVEIWGAWPFVEAGTYSLLSRAPHKVEYLVDNAPTNVGRLLSELSKIWHTMYPRADYVYGFFKGQPVTGWSCGGCSGIGNTDPPYYQMTFAHEAGHGFSNAPHVFGPIGEVGWDVNREMGAGYVKDTELNLMGYMHPSVDSWIAPVSYEHMYNNMHNFVRSQLDPIPPPVSSVMLEIEHDSATGTWSLGDSYETIAATQVSSDLGGPGTIKLLDGNSTELFTTTVTIPTLTDTMATHSGLLPNYIIDLPQLAGVEEIEFYWQGTLEATKVRSANAPVVTITSPQAGSPLTSTTHVAWTATDADGDPMHAIVEYVYANDRVVPVAVGVTGNSAEVQTDSLPSTTSGEIRVRVTDGMNTTVASVAALSLLPNRPPSCYIVAPSSGDTYPAGAGTILHGVGQDPEDDKILDQNVRWYSSLDGFLGSGLVLEVDLSLGSHLITLDVRDSQGAVDTATATVVVTP